MFIHTDCANKVLTVTRAPGERRMKNDSQLLYHLKQQLNAAWGTDLIKKEMVKDGHMVSEGVHYLRARKGTKAGWIMIYDDSYQIRSIAEDFNQGFEVRLEIDNAP